jgi:hypothetical protein
MLACVDANEFRQLITLTKKCPRTSAQHLPDLVHPVISLTIHLGKHIQAYD